MKMSILLSIVLLVGPFVLFIGCAASGSMNVSSVETERVVKPTSKESIALFETADPVSAAYQILGKVFVYKRSPTRFTSGQTKEKALKKILQEQAATLGADAVLKIQFSTTTGQNPQSGWQRWASGIAARFIENNAEQTEGMIDFIVAILPVVNYEQGALKEFKHDHIARSIAQYHLENNGYYAHFTAAEKIVTIEDIQAMDMDARKNLGGKEAAYVLLLTKLGEQTKNIVIAKGASVGIAAQLIFKETGEIFWENAATGNYSAGFLAAAFANEKKEALYPAITEAFSSVPPYKGIVKKEGSTK
jgi:hypothetical protein